MKFTIEKNKLMPEMKIINKAAERKSVIPILQMVLLSVKDNVLTLTASNLDIHIVTKLPIKQTVEGICCVNAYDLTRIVSVCEGELTFEVSDLDNALNVTCGQWQWRLLTVKADQFPEIPTVPMDSIKIPFDKFQRMIRQTKFCMTKEQSRFSLNFIKIELHHSILTLAATDGHRMAVADLKLNQTIFHFEGLISFETPNILEMIKKETECQLAQTVDYWFFTIGHRCVISRKSGSNFPRFRAVIPQTTDILLSFDVAKMTKALQASAITANSYNSTSFVFEKDKVYLRTKNEEGEFKAEIEFETRLGVELDFGINLNYFIGLSQAV